MVFYVDDDYDDLIFFQEAIEMSGRTVTFFKSCEVLMGELEKASLLFLDINIPKKSGLEILAEIRANRDYDSLPVIMFTTSSAIEHIDMAKELGADLYIQKPSSFEKLKSLLDNLLLEDRTKLRTPQVNFFIPD